MNNAVTKYGFGNQTIFVYVIRKTKDTEKAMSLWKLVEEGGGWSGAVKSSMIWTLRVN